MRRASPDLYRKAQEGSLTAEAFEQFTGHKDWRILGSLPEFIRLLTGKIPPDDIALNSPLRHMDPNLRMSTLTSFIEGFEVQNQFWKEESPPSE